MLFFFGFTRLSIASHKVVALPSGFSTTLSDPIGILLVLLALVVMPTTELVLPFNVDGHWITPTTPDPTPPTLPPFLSSNLQQLQPWVLWVLISLPLTITMVVDMSEHQILTRFSVSAFAALFLCLLTSSAYARQTYARQICVAWDPNDSFVNVRQSPNGNILEKKQNGSWVEVVGVSYDTKGTPWVDIVTRGVSGNSFIMKSLIRKCIPGSFNPDRLIVD